MAVIFVALALLASDGAFPKEAVVGAGDGAPGSVSPGGTTPDVASRDTGGRPYFPALTAGGGGTVSGTVTRLDGTTPVSGATVLALMEGVTVVDSTTTDASGQFTLDGLGSGTYDIHAGAEDFVSQTVTAGPALGDVDCDGAVDSVDALFVLRAVAGIPPPAECIDAGDVNCDGDTDSVDALGILRYVAGLPLISTPDDCPPIGVAAAGQASTQSDLTIELATPDELFTGQGLSPELFADTDGDRVPDLREGQLGSTPDSPDSNGDGIPDGVELVSGVLPMHDSLPSASEGSLNGDGAITAQVISPQDGSEIPVPPAGQTRPPIPLVFVPVLGGTRYVAELSSTGDTLEVTFDFGEGSLQLGPRAMAVLSLPPDLPGGDYALTLQAYHGDDAMGAASSPIAISLTETQPAPFEPSSDVEFTGGASILATSVSIPEGVTVRVASGALRIFSQGAIEVDGSIIGENGDGPGMPGAAIELAVVGDVVVRGTVEAGDGSGGAGDVVEALPGQEAVAEGGAGGSGGDVTAVSGSGDVVIAASGRLSAGDGGSGGSASASGGNAMGVRLRGGSGSNGGADAAATGGAGGRGGDLRVQGNQVIPAVREEILKSGNGGAGGSATAPGGAGAPGGPGGLATAIAGAGGESGDLFLPTPDLDLVPDGIVSLQNRLMLGGGRGGQPGEAAIEPGAPGAPLQLWYRAGCEIPPALVIEPSAVSATTMLIADAPAGATQLFVQSAESFELGSIIVIYPGGPTEEQKQLVGIHLGPPDGFVINLPLQFNHSAGETVTQQETGTPTPTPSPTPSPTPTPHKCECPTSRDGADHNPPKGTKGADGWAEPGNGAPVTAKGLDGAGCGKGGSAKAEGGDGGNLKSLSIEIEGFGIAWSTASLAGNGGTAEATGGKGGYDGGRGGNAEAIGGNGGSVNIALISIPSAGGFGRLAIARGGNGSDAPACCDPPGQALDGGGGGNATAKGGDGGSGYQHGGNGGGAIATGGSGGRGGDGSPPGKGGQKGTVGASGGNPGSGIVSGDAGTKTEIPGFNGFDGLPCSGG